MIAYFSKPVRILTNHIYTRIDLLKYLWKTYLPVLLAKQLPCTSQILSHMIGKTLGQVQVHGVGSE